MQAFVIDGPMNEISKKKIKKLNDHIESGKHIFLFLFMVGCGPCKSTREPWLNTKTYLNEEHKKNPNIVVAMVDKDFYPNLRNIGKEPMGFPTLRYINGDSSEEYENAELERQDRSAKSFADWIESKVGKKDPRRILLMNGGQQVFQRRAGGKKQSRGRKRTSRGGKWSLKYKRSIDCNRPKGFSQRQHCKSRKNRKN